MKFKFTLLASAFAFLLNAQTAPSYYNGINFNKTKEALKNDLHDLITNTHTKTIDYKELKTLLAVSDVDPDNPQNLLLIYGSQSSGTHQRSRSKNGSWNREHVYAKSKGTPNLGTSGPGADGHHLRPADVQLNSTRGSHLFDDGVGATAHKTSRGGWYPGDEWKGDVARILMYMYLRYENRAKPLNIAFGPSTYSSDFSDILLKWNIEDPVSQFEIQRNNIVAQTQKNRNPFIDNPYLATAIWGGPAAQNTWPDSFNGTGTNDTQAPTVPTNLSLVSKNSNSATINWTASTDDNAISSYEVFVDNVLKTYVFTTYATITGLTPTTAYNVHIIAKDTSGNRSANSAVLQIITDNAGNPGQGTSCGTEDFNNIPTANGSSYSSRNWTNNGITWDATFARTDNDGYIDGDSNKSICIRKGSLKSSTITGGIGSFSVKTYLPFNDSSGNYILKINGVEKGLIPYSKSATTHTITDINVEGNIIIELIDSTTSNRVSFDNLTWTCYDGLDTKEVSKTKKLSLYPNPVKNKEVFIEGITGKETVSIYNMNGQLVQTINNVNNKQKLVLKSLPKGIYVVKTKDQSSKIIID